MQLADILERGHLPALDGIRAISVFVVIVGHAGYLVPADLGVSAFFVLSGFLITRILLSELTSTGTVSLRNFYARRTLRIFPAYYTFILLSLVLDATRGQYWSHALRTAAFTYTVNYFNALNHHPSTSVAHAWSLAVEEQFYLMWPCVLLVLSLQSRRILVNGIFALGLSVLVWRCYLVTGLHADHAYVYNAFETRFDALAVGCLLASVVGFRQVQAFGASLARTAWMPLVTIGLILVSRTELPTIYHYSVGFSVDAVLFGVLILQLLQLTRTPAWHWLELSWVRYCGTISYPMYLYHQWGAAVGRHLPLSSPAIEFVTGVAATIFLASCSYYVVEQPFLRLKKYFVRTGPSVDGVRKTPLTESVAGVC